MSSTAHEKPGACARRGAVQHTKARQKHVRCMCASVRSRARRGEAQTYAARYPKARRARAQHLQQSTPEHQSEAEACPAQRTKSEARARKRAQQITPKRGTNVCSAETKKRACTTPWHSAVMTSIITCEDIDQRGCLEGVESSLTHPSRVLPGRMRSLNVARLSLKRKSLPDMQGDGTAGCDDTGNHHAQQHTCRHHTCRQQMCIHILRQHACCRRRHHWV
jgi:hypothetical protein